LSPGERIKAIIWQISWIAIIMLSNAYALSVSAQLQSITASTGTPTIDGVVSANEWIISEPLYFMQMQPFKDQPATEPVRLGVQFDDSKIYFLFICLDSDPSRIVSNIAVRDRLSTADDFVLLQIDTYLDHRTGYVFAVNPIGTQYDVAVSDDGKTADANWDAEWFSATSVNDSSWVVEIGIPFSSVRYKKSIDTWGVNFVRMHRYTSEMSTWSGPVNHHYQVSTSGLLEGLDLSGARRSLSVTPYASMRYEDSDLTGNHDRFIPDAGLDARWQFTQGSIANLTVNPDFATVEGDQEQINLSRWELQYPEKRPFFLEGNDMYQTRIQTFYSRRIGDIYGGAKVAGKEGKYAYSLIGAYSVRDTAEDVPNSFYTIARIKRDILNSSAVGFTFTDKRNVRGSATTYSADYILNLGKDWKLTGQFAGASPGNLYDNMAYFIRFAKESNLYHVHLRYSYAGKDFMDHVNQTGFVREDDMQEFDSDIEYTWWFEKTIFKYIYAGSYNNVFWSHDYAYLRSWNFTQEVKFYLKNRLSLGLTYNNEYKLYDKKYYNHRYSAGLGYNTDEWSSALAAYSCGRNYDRDFQLFTFLGKVRLWKRLSIEYELDRLAFNPDTTSSSTWINILTLEYYFTRDIWLKLFVQNRTNTQRWYIYGQFGWRFRPPFGAVYLVYTSDDFDDIPNDTRINSDIVFLKVSYQIGR
jgi:hypothetical protein